MRATLSTLWVLAKLMEISSRKDERPCFYTACTKCLESITGYLAVTQLQTASAKLTS